jgi:tRNA-2-methylthio-N6-dimethylallyladenosine synthase
MGKYFIKTYGCQANVHDAAKLAVVLESVGYEPIDDVEQSDIALIVTCVVRQNAEDRAAGYIRSLTGAKERNPNLKIAVCGCLVTEPGRDLQAQFPHVDLFILPNDCRMLADYLHLTFDLPVRQAGIGHLSLVPHDHGPTSTTYVSIMNGCDNYCSYCVVPYVRGRETSRPMADVLAETKELIGQGITDITLLGQNVNSYRFGLSDLLIAIHSFVISHSSLVIRFMTSHPKDMSDVIIETIAKLPYVAKEFHLPAQSGDDDILKAMNRKYTVDYYLDRIAKIRSLMPAARITSDLMVGFPGETEAQFKNTLKLLEQVRFNAVNMFAYSPRPMTAAAKMLDQVPDEIKEERLQRLIGLNRETLNHNQQLNVAVNGGYN